MNVAGFLTDPRDRDSPAFFVGERPTLSHGALCERVARRAHWLRVQAGLDGGDRVAVFMRNSPEYVEWIFASWWAGLTVVPVNARLHAAELRYILQDSGARCCLTDPELAPVTQVAAEGLGAATGAGIDLDQTPAMDPAVLATDELAWLFYTSGTTGRPKGACLSHGNLRAMVRAFLADIDDLAGPARWIHAAPLSHGSGLYGLAAMARGVPLVFPASGGFTPGELCRLLQSHPGSCGFFVPTMLGQLLAAPEFTHVPADNVRTLVYGGAPMPVAECRALIRRLPGKLVQIYGQGESPMTITVLPRTDHTDDEAGSARLATVGRAQYGVEVQVVDEQGCAAPAGVVGEVTVRGDTVMSGYWRNPAATAETLRGGWLHTGDLGEIDARGYLTLRGRSKDLIISGGQNIYPREVEDVLERHAGVKAVAVVGRPCPQWGERCVAFVVPAGADSAGLEQSLEQLCLDNLARYKRPREYHFVSELPLNPVGKVQKSVLRASLARTRKTPA